MQSPGQILPAPLVEVLFIPTSSVMSASPLSLPFPIFPPVWFSQYDPRVPLILKTIPCWKAGSVDTSFCLNKSTVRWRHSHRGSCCLRNYSPECSGHIACYQETAFSETWSAFLNTGVVHVYVWDREPGGGVFDRQCLFPEDIEVWIKHHSRVQKQEKRNLWHFLQNMPTALNKQVGPRCLHV